MTGIARTALSAVPSAAHRALRDFLSTVVSTVAAWSGRARQRRALAGLDDHILRDIGIDSRKALEESARPFWKT